MLLPCENGIVKKVYGAGRGYNDMAATKPDVEREKSACMVLQRGAKSHRAESQSHVGRRGGGCLEDVQGITEDAKFSGLSEWIKSRHLQT